MWSQLFGSSLGAEGEQCSSERVSAACGSVSDDWACVTLVCVSKRRSVYVRRCVEWCLFLLLEPQQLAGLRGKAQRYSLFLESQSVDTCVCVHTHGGARARESSKAETRLKTQTESESRLPWR